MDTLQQRLLQEVRPVSTFTQALKQHESLKADLLTSFKEFMQTNPKMGKVVISAALEAMCEAVRDHAPCKHSACFVNAISEAKDFLTSTALRISLEMLLKEEEKKSGV